MTDLVCLVADKNMEAMTAGALSRPARLGIRQISHEIVVHPRRDPGCFHESAELLTGYRDLASHAMVLLDHEWEGVPARSGVELEVLLEQKLQVAGPDKWARGVVIDPELEAWVFSDSPHVADVLGWKDRTPTLRDWLRNEGLWPDGYPKPRDPKEAVDRALREVRWPRSSSLYRTLAERVSFGRCTDRAFIRFRGLLAEWFPIPGA